MNNNTPQPTKYFLYIRKSTDEEDRQVLSLEAQLHEAKEFAEHEGIEIVETFVEKKTAKVPGREIFNSMLNKIESGLPHSIGILAWAPDRLSRNSVDGGRLIYLLDTGKLATLKFPTFAFENNPSGKFFLAIGLSNAKYYVDNLAENVRRGNRAKLRRGEWPGQKPFGYVYDHRLRNIVPEPKEAKIVKKIYEEFATGRHTLKSISARLAELGGGKTRSNYSIENLLTNDRYIGIMRWNGEAYEGKYHPLITKQLFAKVQEVLANRRKPRKSKKRHDFPFVGLFNCSCGSMFTAQFAKGNGGLYRYYRCTRKHGACAEKYIQEYELQKQIIEKSQTIALPADWTKEMLEKLEHEEKLQAQSADAFAEANRKKIFALQEKLDKLLEGYLDNLIDEDTYKRKKENLVQQKIALKGEQDTLLRKRRAWWIEPMRDYINTLIYAGKIASEQSPQEIAHFAQKIGTNRLISEKIVSWDFVPPFDFAQQFLASRASRRGEQTIALASKKSRSPVWCPLFENARTFFERN
jgi:DNA invertase Pin-like site-specific DNA recombinase